MKLRYSFGLALVSVFLILPSRATSGEEPAAKKPTPDERKRKFEALKKELEALKPAPGAEIDELLTYLQTAITMSTKFAKENPQTAEGFEAAFNAAVQLANSNHAKTGELAQAAIDAAPAAGVDQRQLATCWVLVAYGKLIKNDFEGGRAALEKMKPMDAELYERAKAQVDTLEAQKKDAKK